MNAVSISHDLKRINTRVRNDVTFTNNIYFFSVFEFYMLGMPIVA